MSKFTRGELKDIIKECLIEILSEGLALGAPSLQPARPAPSRPRPQQSQPTRASSPALNSVTFGATSKSRPQASSRPTPPRPAIVESIGAITSDPVMSQIFADTAGTTLQEQVQAESSRPGMPSGEELVGSPVDIFSEGAKNWATLAFSDSPKR